MGRVKSTKNSKEDEDQSTTGLILSKFNSIQQTLDVKIAALFKENKKMADDIKQLKEIISDQNKVIVDLLSEVHVLVKTSLGPAMISNKYLDYFPIETERELDEMEFEISEETKEAIGATIKKIVGKDGIRKKLTEIFSESLLYDYNLNGRQNKKSLLDYPKLIKLIFNSVQKEEQLTKSNFMNEIRIAIRLLKNKKYKHGYIQRKREKNSFCDEQNDGEDDSNDENSSPRIDKSQNVLSFSEL